VAELAALIELRLIEEIEREAAATADPQPATDRITASFSS
jgi:phthiocerol/phenolphthiocerol synthesis type-I polyketide synthase E